ncbi:MAG: DUF4388 domain-containing protein [Myxococcota bacterium]
MSIPTVLVVEDDVALSDHLQELLEREGFQVLIERDGARALALLERRLPSLLLTDVLLPELGGFELVSALREMSGGAELPVVVMSGIFRATRHRREAEESLGVVSYLHKPFGNEQLLEVLRRALGPVYPAQTPRVRRVPPALRTVPEADPLAGDDTRDEKAEVERAAASLLHGKTVRGSLRHRRFPELLSQLYRWRETGALLLQRESIKKIVYLKDGHPIFVKSNLLSECLGRVLVQARMLSEKDCERSLARMKKRRRQQGTTLVEMGVLSPRQLVQGLQLQLEQKLFDIFRWTEGEYQFNPRLEVPPQAVHLDMSIATIIYEGVRRGFSLALLRDLLAPFAQSYLAVHPDPLHRFQDISLEADERKVVALVDGRRTLHEILERCELSEIHSRQLLYALLAAEMLQPQPRRARRKDPLELGAPPSTRPPPLPVHRTGVGPASPPSMEGDLAGLSTQDLRAHLVDRVRELQRQNAFEVLGVSRRATEDEVRRAYLSATRSYHRDRLPRDATADARALAEQVESALKHAFETLRDGMRPGRETPDVALPTGRAPQEVGRVLNAEGAFQRGRLALGRQDYGAATRHFTEAVNLYPEEGEFYAYRGWSLFLSAPTSEEAVQTAEQDMREGIQRNPRCEHGWMFLGRLLRETGRGAAAVYPFEQALHCNPDNREAIEALGLLRRRAPRVVRVRGGA